MSKKHVHQSILTVVLEAAKHNYDGDVFLQVIKDCGIDNNRAQLICSKFVSLKSFSMLSIILSLEAYENRKEGKIHRLLLCNFHLFIIVIELRNELARNSFHADHVVDVEWRLDYHISSNNVSKIGSPL